MAKMQIAACDPNTTADLYSELQGIQHKGSSVIRFNHQETLGMILGRHDGQVKVPLHWLQRALLY
jgi:hypothetical protein